METSIKYFINRNIPVCMVVSASQIVVFHLKDAKGMNLSTLAANDAFDTPQRP